ncbi:NAD(P)/FAD-dependent oxidoreductase [Paenibacillus daejeonensis]|uniref:NAD(P)/FAD-dependent oxidoreductase n=1 Tax=Paenibacillus daejeonensis TaxID=135193 RepID=UPI000362D4C5|nr:NAD(P)/FAD-dependent oxidoreductase [Paenibacillus daejeonensis]
MTYDIIIIGGGSAGLMAAVAASRGGARVLLLDKGNRLGRKLGISGGGRCNVTNNKELDEIIRHIPGNGRFLHSAFSIYSNREIIAFFEGLGIPLKEEDNGRMFPVSDKAKTVVDALISQVRRQGVEIRTDQAVQEVLYADGAVRGVRLISGERVYAGRVIIATGGCSVPHTGSTGDGYAWAEAAGHTITELFPTEVPLRSSDAHIASRELQGLSLRDVTLTVWNAKGKRVITHRGDLLFTHFGLSGPIALRCSQYVVKELKRSDSVTLTVDLFPDTSADELYASTWKLAETESKKAIKTILRSLVQERLVPVLLAKAELLETTTFDNLPKANLLELSRLMKAFPVHIHDTLSLEEAFVTGGGVTLKEIDPKTMQSKLMRGLYFCGEILDIHGYTGGYNITAAFSTGHAAGTHAAEEALVPDLGPG